MRNCSKYSRNLFRGYMSLRISCGGRLCIFHSIEISPFSCLRIRFWYDMIWYIYLLQLGFHAVAVVVVNWYKNRKESAIYKRRNNTQSIDIVGTVYHLVIYMQSNKIHKVFQGVSFIQHLCYLDMFRTSSVHHQERFVQAVFTDFGMW